MSPLQAITGRGEERKGSSGVTKPRAESRHSVVSLEPVTCVTLCCVTNCWLWLSEPSWLPCCVQLASWPPAAITLIQRAHCFGCARQWHICTPCVHNTCPCTTNQSQLRKRLNRLQQHAGCNPFSPTILPPCCSGLPCSALPQARAADGDTEHDELLSAPRMVLSQWVGKWIPDDPQLLPGMPQAVMNKMLLDVSGGG